MGFIRLLLAICVVLTHTTGALPYVGRMLPGSLAVQAFFMLSGFYMALVLNERYTRTSEFYWNRFSRIFSGYWVALLASVVLRLAVGDPVFEQFWSEPVTGGKALVLFANLFLFGADWIFFLNGDLTPPLWNYLMISPAWSLPVELCFYLLAPFVVRSIPKMLLLAATSLVVRSLTLDAFGPGDPWETRFMPSELMYFLSGAIAYRLLPLVAVTPRTAGIVMFAICGFGIGLYEHLPPGSAWVLIWLLAVSAPFILDSVRGRLDRMAGEISYMVYLIHVPIIISFSVAFNAPMGVAFVIPASILAAIVLDLVASRADAKWRAWFRIQRLRYADQLNLTDSQIDQIATARPIGMDNDLEARGRR